MNAIEMLKEEHKGAKKSINEIAAATGPQREKLFSGFKRELEVHDSIEEKIFYPAVQAHEKTSGFLAADKTAHVEVELALAGLAGMKSDDAGWMPAFNTMRGKLFKHMSDEENNLFKKVAEAMTGVELIAIGTKMAAEKELQLKAAPLAKADQAQEGAS